MFVVCFSIFDHSTKREQVNKNLIRKERKGRRVTARNRSLISFLGGKVFSMMNFITLKACLSTTVFLILQLPIRVN
jgi:hypothetical protein